MDVKKGMNKLYVGDDEANSLARITWNNGGNNIIVVNHTFVDPSLRGQGYAKLLLKALVDMCREEGLKIVPACTFIVNKMTNTDEYSDILYKS